ncbi:DEAD/DEAH box helicase [Spirochaeta dissipatitropha]
MTSHTFSDLGLADAILKAVEKQGYTTPTPIQAQAIPGIMNGRDLLGTAQTGTGKTAAFVLPVLHQIIESGVFNTSNASRGGSSRNNDRSQGARRNGRNSGGRDSRRPAGDPVAAATPQALILAPTRELAIQIGESIREYSSGSQIRHGVIYGGAPKPGQATKLMTNPDILAATPGRLMDFIDEGRIDLSEVQILILDEADRMLDMGFIPDVEKIAAMAVKRRQTVLFSATMPRAIEKLANELLTDPERVAITPAEVTVDRIQQSVMHMDRESKAEYLPQLIQDLAMFRVIVFTKTKHRAAKLAKQLSKLNIPSDAIHGDRTQGQRQRALESFKKGKIQALVATDVAARGIDVDDVSHVINYEIPNEAESYIHRIGRTGRAGTEGTAIALCSRDELRDFRAIEQLLGTQIDVNRDHPFHLEPPAARAGRAGGGRSSGGNGGRGPGRGPSRGPGRGPARTGQGPDSRGPGSSRSQNEGWKPGKRAAAPAGGHHRDSSPSDNRGNRGNQRDFNRSDRPGEYNAQTSIAEMFTREESGNRYNQGSNGRKKAAKPFHGASGPGGNKGRKSW